MYKIKCWFVGHDERMGCVENYEEPYCNRCKVSWPQDMRTLPGIKEEMYWWFMELIESRLTTNATELAKRCAKCDVYRDPTGICQNCGEQDPANPLI